MSEGWVEREGGIWVVQPPVPSRLVSERFDRQRETFQIIWQRLADGHFQAAFLVKDKTSDPQWSLPFWTDVAQGGIFESHSAADAHLQSIADAQPLLCSAWRARSRNIRASLIRLLQRMRLL